mmetsp:Transcript_91292/g.293211  ORF Transcript_91292/g.293211 Transcript_91292/m.293211 type:complete len:331 (-) Transcript_91292:491-1483(-)
MELLAELLCEALLLLDRLHLRGVRSQGGIRLLPVAVELLLNVLAFALEALQLGAQSGDLALPSALDRDGLVLHIQLRQQPPRAVSRLLVAPVRLAAFARVVGTAFLGAADQAPHIIVVGFDGDQDTPSLRNLLLRGRHAEDLGDRPHLLLQGQPLRLRLAQGLPQLLLALLVAVDAGLRLLHQLLVLLDLLVLRGEIGLQLRHLLGQLPVLRGAALEPCLHLLDVLLRLAHDLRELRLLLLPSAAVFLLRLLQLPAPLLELPPQGRDLLGRHCRRGALRGAAFGCRGRRGRGGRRPPVHGGELLAQLRELRVQRGALRVGSRGRRLGRRS